MESCKGRSLLFLNNQLVVFFKCYYVIYYRSYDYPSYLFHRLEGQAYVTPLPYGYDYPCPVVVTLGVICSGTATSYHKDYGLMLIDHRPFVYSLAEGLQRDSQGYFLPKVRGFTAWGILVVLALLAAVMWATRRLFPRRAQNGPGLAARLAQRLRRASRI